MNDVIDQFLLERIEAGDFPSAVYLVAERGEVRIAGAVGNAVVDPKIIKAELGTIYDVASLTKVLSTGLLSAMLIEQGEISLDDLVSDHLPDISSEDKHDITLGQLLTHTARLPAWKPFYLCVDDAADICEEIDRTLLLDKPASVVYSDLGFILLGKVIERITGTSLDAAFEDMIADPLGLVDTRYLPFSITAGRTAASEKGNAYEKNTCIEKGYDAAKYAERFRDDVIWGEVHDGNAYFMGGVAGHAGIFSTAQEMFEIAKQFLPSTTSLLEAETCEIFRTNLTCGANESRSVAFQLAETTDSSAGTSLSPQSFGHLGFTGTSLWVDPTTERIFILLTNRTHDHELPFVILNSVRRRFHDLATIILNEK